MIHDLFFGVGLGTWVIKKSDAFGAQQNEFPWWSLSVIHGKMIHSFPSKLCRICRFVNNMFFGRWVVDIQMFQSIASEWTTLKT